jgi:hypothetical protein
MKKKELTPIWKTNINPLQQEGGKKLNDEQIKQNIQLLTEDFLAIGLPESLKAGVLKELRRRSGENFSLPFEMRVGKLAVKGWVFLKPKEPNGLYTPVFYILRLEWSLCALTQENPFLCTPGSMVSVEEAVNLMEGRYIYRKAEVDPDGEGYWIRLERSCTLPGIRCLEHARPKFNVDDFLTRTGLGDLLGLEEWFKMVSDLEKGYRCDLQMWTGEGMRTVKVEADPEQRRLKVMDERDQKAILPNITTSGIYRFMNPD